MAGDDSFDVDRWASRIFRSGFYSDTEPLPEHREQTPSDLVRIAKHMGLERSQLEATWKTLRDIALLAVPDPLRELNDAQRRALEDVRRSSSLPSALRSILRHATSKVKEQRDLHLLAFVFVSAWERF